MLLSFNTPNNQPVFLLATRPATNLILALLCLKNCRNLGISTLRGRLRASES